MSQEVLKSSVTWDGKGVSSVLSNGRHSVAIDEEPHFGGEDKGFNPLELLLGGLGGCMTVVATMFAKQHKVDLKGLRIDLETRFDINGFQEKTDVRPGLLDIKVNYHVESSSPKENIEALLAHVERVCPARDTLARGTTIIRDPALAGLAA